MHGVIMKQENWNTVGQAKTGNVEHGKARQVNEGKGKVLLVGRRGLRTGEVPFTVCRQDASKCQRDASRRRQTPAGSRRGAGGKPAGTGGEPAGRRRDARRTHIQKVFSRGGNPPETSAYQNKNATHYFRAKGWFRSRHA